MIKSFLDCLVIKVQHSLLKIKNCDEKMMTSHVIVCIQIVFIWFTGNKKEMKLEKNPDLISKKKRYISLYLTRYIIMQIRFHVNLQGFNSGSFNYYKNDLHIAVLQQFLSFDYQMLNFFLLLNCLIFETIFN